MKLFLNCYQLPLGIAMFLLVWCKLSQQAAGFTLRINTNAHNLFTIQPGIFTNRFIDNSRQSKVFEFDFNRNYFEKIKPREENIYTSTPETLLTSQSYLVNSYQELEQISLLDFLFNRLEQLNLSINSSDDFALPDVPTLPKVAYSDIYVGIYDFELVKNDSNADHGLRSKLEQQQSFISREKLPNYLSNYTGYQNNNNYLLQSNTNLTTNLPNNLILNSPDYQSTYSDYPKPSLPNYISALINSVSVKLISNPKKELSILNEERYTSNQIQTYPTLLKIEPKLEKSAIQHELDRAIYEQRIKAEKRKEDLQKQLRQKLEKTREEQAKKRQQEKQKLEEKKREYLLKTSRQQQQRHKRLQRELFK